MLQAGDAVGSGSPSTRKPDGGRASPARRRRSPPHLDIRRRRHHRIPVRLELARRNLAVTVHGCSSVIWADQTRSGLRGTAQDRERLVPLHLTSLPRVRRTGTWCRPHAYGTQTPPPKGVLPPLTGVPRQRVRWGGCTRRPTSRSAADTENRPCASRPGRSRTYDHSSGRQHVAAPLLVDSVSNPVGFFSASLTSASISSGVCGLDTTSSRGLLHDADLDLHAETSGL